MAYFKQQITELKFMVLMLFGRNYFSTKQLHVKIGSRKRTVPRVFQRFMITENNPVYVALIGRNYCDQCVFYIILYHRIVSSTFYSRTFFVKRPISN